jgi:hypothetical protein
LVKLQLAPSFSFLSIKKKKNFYPGSGCKHKWNSESSSGSDFFEKVKFGFNSRNGYEKTSLCFGLV